MNDNLGTIIDNVKSGSMRNSLIETNDTVEDIVEKEKADFANTMGNGGWPPRLIFFKDDEVLLKVKVRSVKEVDDDIESALIEAASAGVFFDCDRALYIYDGYLPDWCGPCDGGLIIIVATKSGIALRLLAYTNVDGHITYTEVTRPSKSEIESKTKSSVFSVKDFDIIDTRQALCVYEMIYASGHNKSIADRKIVFELLAMRGHELSLSQ